MDRTDEKHESSLGEDTAHFDETGNPAFQMRLDPIAIRPTISAAHRPKAGPRRSSPKRKIPVGFGGQSHPIPSITHQRNRELRVRFFGCPSEVSRCLPTLWNLNRAQRNKSPLTRT